MTRLHDRERRGVKPQDDPRRLLAEYGDLRFREGSAFALGDRDTGKAKADAAAKLFERLLTMITKPKGGK